MKSLAHSKLLELIHYDPDTGAFTRRLARGYVPAGIRADYQHKESGYRRVNVAGHKLSAHRLAWFYMTGAWPDQEIDHKNRNKADNAWRNLRLATTAQNGWNASRKPGASGVKGVNWHKATGRWRARCRANGREHTMGYFEDIELAEFVVQEFRDTLHGEFARHA